MQVLKLLELVIPLVTIPVVIDKLGLDSFGFFSILLVSSQYLILIGDWGFNVNAAREFSVKSIYKVRFIILFRDIQRAKFIFLLIMLLIFLLLSIIFDFDFKLVIVSWLFIAASVMQCTWFFQARYLLLPLLLVSFISKIFYVIYIFYFLDSNSLVSTYFFWFSVSVFFTSIYANIKFVFFMKDGFSHSILKNKYWCDFFINRFSKSFNILFVEGWYLVSSRVVSSLNTPIFYYLSKCFFGLEFVGFFSVAQRIVSSVVSLLIPLVDVTFPYLSQLVTNKMSIKRYVISILSLVFFINVVALFFIFYFKFFIFDFFKIEYSYEHFIFLLIYTLIIFLSITGNLMVNVLVAKHMSSRVFKCVIIGNLFSYFLFFIFYSFINESIIVAISVVINQLVISYLLFMSSRSLKVMV